ncbi:MAG: glycine oxidase ThiO [Actinomycetota bacterium]|nr:glycine oxidase ThiO [Actinomycetota bacterium]
MRVAVIGAGIIGLACAYELGRGGHTVLVYDAEPAGGATHAAAGMISPAGEAWYGEEALLWLGLASAAMWPDFAAGLSAATGVDVDYRNAGTLLVGKDRDDLANVLRTVSLLVGQGIEAEQLGCRELVEREPTLDSRVAGGAFLPDDHSVNPRKAAAALMANLDDRLIRVNARPDVVDGKCWGVVTEDGLSRRADAVVVATGHRLGEMGLGTRRLVRPVRGEVIRVQTDDPPERTIRAAVRGRSVYAVPRAGGEVIIGATSEERAGEPVPTVGGVLQLLNDARTLLPTLDSADILDIVCRFRPGTPDNGPLIGPSSTPGLFVAGGHHRGGVLLAPITALAIRAYLDGGDVPDVVRRFRPDRFETLPADPLPTETLPTDTWSNV